jgi:hypothetical protein
MIRSNTRIGFALVMLVMQHDEFLVVLFSLIEATQALDRKARGPYEQRM